MGHGARLERIERRLVVDESNLCHADALGLVEALLVLEDVHVEVLLQLLVGVVDEQL